MASSYRFVATGQVQGVGFRQSARRKAVQLNISGWIANRADGAVEGLAHGDEAALGRFHTWLGDGPPMARVLTLEWQRSDEVPAPGFVIVGQPSG
jgi:acylphosphatase